MVDVSIIIPAYNAMVYLPEALQSVLAQTYAHYEIIIVNDGSRDHLEQWVATLSDSRIRLLSQANQGKSAARNAGIRAAEAEYIAFLDADDLWEPTKLERQLEVMKRHPDMGVVYTWTALADAAGQVTGRSLTPTEEGNVWPALVQSNLLTCGSTPLIRKVCFDEVGFFAPNLPLSQDWEMWIRLATKFQFGVVRSPLVRYRQHDGNTSMNWRKMRVCITRVLESAIENAPQHLDPSTLNEIRANALQSMFLYLGWLAFRNAEYDEAHGLWNEAAQANRAKRFSSESLRLRVAIALGHILGKSSYQQLSQFIYQARRTFSSHI